MDKSDLKTRISRLEREIEVREKQLQQGQLSIQKMTQELISKMGGLVELKKLVGEDKNEDKDKDKGNESGPASTESVKD